MKYTDKQILDFLSMGGAILHRMGTKSMFGSSYESMWWMTTDKDGGQLHTGDDLRATVSETMAYYKVPPPTEVGLTVHKCTCPQCTSEVVV